MKKIILLILVAVAAIFIYNGGGYRLFRQAKALQSNKETKIAPQEGGVTIVHSWDLPSELEEVSGIAWMDADRFICVQDEKGVIFIFNTKTGSIEKQIPFADPGDFEGLTLAGNTAWAVRSDGVLYEVNMSNGNTTEYKNFLKAANNIEGLCYDAAGKRLLLAGKDGDESFAGYKCVYAFDLHKKKLQEIPAYKIDLNDPLLAGSGKNKSKALRPSAIGIAPGNKNIFITDGPSSKLVELNSKGDLKKIYKLGKNFHQPEGISFSPDGRMFISNEGGSKPANINEVKL
ncbi:MAG: hypothetical protein EOO03_08735 [Chitinophagaceae bacterium]|nr:MAG: hypothetical protein EOO03_08735 [Chitinophagaceae bacterium]